MRAKVCHPEATSVNLLNHFLLFQPFYLGLILDLQESCKKIYSRVPFYPSPHRIVTKNRKSTLALQLSHRPYLNLTNIFMNILFLFQDLIWNPALRLVIISRQSPPVCNGSSLSFLERGCALLAGMSQSRCCILFRASGQGVDVMFLVVFS